MSTNLSHDELYNVRKRYKNYRDKPNPLHVVQDRRGNEVVLNFEKKLFKGEIYDNLEYQREYLRWIRSLNKKEKE